MEATSDRPCAEARKAAEEITEQLCRDPLVWATHGIPPETKVVLIEAAIAAKIDSLLLRWAPSTLPPQLPTAVAVVTGAILEELRQQALGPGKGLWLDDGTTADDMKADINDVIIDGHVDLEKVARAVVASIARYPKIGSQP